MVSREVPAGKRAVRDVRTARGLRQAGTRRRVAAGVRIARRRGGVANAAVFVAVLMLSLVLIFVFA